MAIKVLLINGPNLNLLGTREPHIYGHTTLQDVETKLSKLFKSKTIELVCLQTSIEGEIVDFIHNHREAAHCIINAGALTHTSIALRDAFKGVGMKFVEVHISNVHARESFRHHSFLSDIADGIVVGCGVFGYEMAAQFVIQQIRPKAS